MAFLLSLFRTVTFRNGYFSFDTPSRVANNLLSSCLFPLLAYFCLQEMIFLLIYLLLLLNLLTFAPVNKLAMTYPANSAQQRNFDFFAFFSALYLVVSDILLTHTHTGATSV